MVNKSRGILRGLQNENERTRILKKKEKKKESNCDSNEMNENESL